MAWEPRQRGTNADGEPSYSNELVPKRGTRREFMCFLRQALEAYLPHYWDLRMMQRGLLVFEQHKGPTTATIRSDYAAQIRTIRVRNATCATPETHNLCVTVVGHSPYWETIHYKKHGARPAYSKPVRKQKVSVFFGFHDAGHRPSARTFNVLREDVSSVLKHGTTKHGEWFHKGERLPSTRTRPPPPLPDGDGLNDAAEFAAIFPELEIEADQTDGCAAQFDGIQGQLPHGRRVARAHGLAPHAYDPHHHAREEHLRPALEHDPRRAPQRRRQRARNRAARREHGGVRLRRVRAVQLLVVSDEGPRRHGDAAGSVQEAARARRQRAVADAVARRLCGDARQGSGAGRVRRQQGQGHRGHLLALPGARQGHDRDGAAGARHRALREGLVDRR
mmetsp:Transcript_2435/g.7592  ORF Transcript_2435/g.7592 Transcript_2435/m.7592 type:complete len:392 (+) Transcript_2435:754-1929(+)